MFSPRRETDFFLGGGGGFSFVLTGLVSGFGKQSARQSVKTMHVDLFFLFLEMSWVKDAMVLMHGLTRFTRSRDPSLSSLETVIKPSGILDKAEIGSIAKF